MKLDICTHSYDMMNTALDANLFEFSKPEDFQEGRILLIDKPLEWTSFDVVNKVRFLIRRHCGFKKIKVGHAGTLDPLATGVLVICTGRMTKQINRFLVDNKCYDGAMRLGATTASYDREQPEENVQTDESVATLTLEGLQGLVAERFVGEISQVPPQFSAKKVDGRRAYKSARKGQEVVLQPVDVVVSRFEVGPLTAGEPGRGAELAFEIDCSKGTYIRALGRDLGEAAGCGAYLSKLRRTRSGEFSLADCHQLDALEARIEQLAHLAIPTDSVSPPPSPAPQKNEGLD